MRGRLAAFATLLVSLLIAAPAGAATREQQQGAFAVPTSTAPMRDLVIDRPTRALARTRASSSLARYDVHDGAGRSVDIQVSVLCAATCDAADPQAVADFLGTLPHNDEINLLTLQLVKPPTEMAAACGSSLALSCYYPNENLIVASGDNFTASDNATRNYVLAHEFGHHVANHRNNAPFANPAIDWGPKRWASFAGVCQGVRAGRYFPGDEGGHYYQNPGEAFAESFARTVFPNDPVPWEWPDFPDARPAGFAAVQQDALSPWNGNSVDRRKGRFGKRRKVKRQRKAFATPRDGELTVTLKGPDRAALGLKLRSADGRLVARSDGAGSSEQVHYTICGERSFGAVVPRHTRRRARYKVTAILP